MNRVLTIILVVTAIALTFPFSLLFIIPAIVCIDRIGNNSKKRVDEINNDSISMLQSLQRNCQWQEQERVLKDVEVEVVNERENRTFRTLPALSKLRGRLSNNNFRNN